MVYSSILEKVRDNKKQLVVLIDPETDLDLNPLLQLIDGADVDMIFLGGSTYASSALEILTSIRLHTSKPVVLFPGNAGQLTPGVDAVLFLSLLSGRNSDYLISNHVKAAPALRGVEVIPVAYLLLDGGRVSSTQKVTRTLPMSMDNVDAIVNTAYAGQLLGHKLVYLEAGSGALQPIPAHVISQVKSSIDIPLIVGGGLKSAQDMKSAYDAGADIVVVGNALERNPNLLSTLVLN